MLAERESITARTPARVHDRHQGLALDLWQSPSGRQTSGGQVVGLTAADERESYLKAVLMTEQQQQSDHDTCTHSKLSGLSDDIVDNIHLHHNG